eukprot:m.103618 g.103618  ORF g.103618 m.103618 type:complete len:579 (+) comp27511_c0_seq1:243-1979(+)
MSFGRSAVSVLFLFALFRGTVSINSVLLTDGKKLCVECNLWWGNLPESQTDAREMEMVFAEPATGGCVDSNLTSPTEVTNADSFKGKAVVFKRGNCTFTAMMDVVHANGGTAVLVLNHEGSLIYPASQNENATDYVSKLAFCMIQQQDIDDIQVNANISLYAEPYHTFDPSAGLFLLLACGCILCGSYLGTERERYYAFTDVDDRRTARHPPAAPTEAEEKSQELTPRKIVLFIVMASTFLMLLYFLFKYLVYILIVVFAVFGSLCLHDLLSEAASRTSLWRHRVNLPKFPDSPIISIVLLGGSLTLALVWGIERHASWAWVLQDILGVSVLTTIVKLVSIPNLKIATILLSLLLLYDVFFVFITPLFTGKESVMIHAATGGTGESAASTDSFGCVHANEMLPFLLRSPRWLTPGCACPADSMLGFGDVAFPGWLVALCMRFDCYRAMKKGGRRGGAASACFSRYRFTCIGIGSYAIGLIMAFVAAGLSDSPQPALLYLSPCTLGAVWFAGWIHGSLAPLLNLSNEMKTLMSPQSRVGDGDTDNATTVQGSESSTGDTVRGRKRNDDQVYLLESDSDA